MVNQFYDILTCLFTQSTENPHTEHAKGLKQIQTENTTVQTSENVDLAELCKLMRSSCVCIRKCREQSWRQKEGIINISIMVKVKPCSFARCK